MTEETTQASPTKSSSRMSDAAVQAKTGKTWPEWFALLDAEGAAEKTHQEIVAYLRERHGISGWWQQMVTNTYEQERGLRAKHQMPDGYQVSAMKTIAAPVAAVFNAWTDDALRRRWLGDMPITIRKATPGKSLRITWSDGKSSLEVNLYDRGTGKSQVAVQHSKLVSAEEAARMKSYWAAAVARLKQVLEEPAS